MITADLVVDETKRDTKRRRITAYSLYYRLMRTLPQADERDKTSQG
jgi:hypothetical protein